MPILNQIFPAAGSPVLLYQVPTGKSLRHGRVLACNQGVANDVGPFGQTPPIRIALQPPGAGDLQTSHWVTFDWPISANGVFQLSFGESGLDAGSKVWVQTGNTVVSFTLMGDLA